MIKLVIFDFDDTLCLTEEACFHLENKIAKDMGFAPMTRAAHHKNWGKFLGDAIVERIPGIDPVEFLKRQEEYFSKYMSESGFDSIKQENLDVLDELKQVGKKLAVLTNRSLVETKHLMHVSHPLSSRMDFFYYKDILDYHKPDPRAFDQALRYFKVEPMQTVYVGDSLGDAHAAKNAGMHFIAVLESGIRKKIDFKDIPVDFFARKFTDILPYILAN